MRNHEGHRHLTIVRFPQPATGLPFNSHRMLTAFGESSIINDPVLDLAQMEQSRQRLLTNHTQERTVFRGRNRDEVMQRLMSSAKVTRIDASRDRLDAFTFASQEQAGDVVAQRLYAIGMIKFFAQQGQVIFKTLCTSRSPIAGMS